MTRSLVRNPGRDWLPLRHVAIEERLSELDQHQVGDDHSDEEPEEGRRQGLEPQHVRERRVRKIGADCHAEKRGEGQRLARAAAEERNPTRPSA